MIFAQINLHYIIAREKTFERVYRFFLESGDGRLLESLFFLKMNKKLADFYRFLGDGRLLEYGRLLEFLRYFIFNDVTNVTLFTKLELSTVFLFKFSLFYSIL